MTIPNIVFVILIGITTAYLPFLTTKGGLTDNRFKSLTKRFTNRGKTVIFILFIMLLLLIGQEYNNQNLNRNNESALKKEFSLRDSIITTEVKSGIDSSRKKLFGDLSKAFAEEALLLDTLSNRIQIIRDSVKTTIINNHGDAPILMLDKNSVFLKDSSKKGGGYRIAFKSIDAGSSGFNVACYLLTEDQNGSDLSKFNFFPKGLKIPKNSAWTVNYGTSEMPRAKFIYIYLLGSYSNIDGTQKYPIDHLYLYDSTSNRTTTLLNAAREKTIKLIKSIPDDKFIVR